MGKKVWGKKYGKNIPENSTKTKVREQKYGNKITEKKVRVKKYGKKSTGIKSKGKSHVTSGDVTSGQACAMVRSPSNAT